MGRELTPTEKSYPMGSEFKNGFSSQLSWSHYRALMRVAKPDARDFYEREAIECGWDKRSLERQIHSQYYERMLVSQNPQQMIESARCVYSGDIMPIITIKLVVTCSCTLYLHRSLCG